VREEHHQEHLDPPQRLEIKLATGVKMVQKPAHAKMWEEKAKYSLRSGGRGEARGREKLCIAQQGDGGGAKRPLTN